MIFEKAEPGAKYGVEVTFRAPSEVSIGWDDGEPYAVVDLRMILTPKGLLQDDMTAAAKEDTLRQVASAIVAELHKKP